MEFVGRTILINYLIQEHGYKSYLEIGLNNPYDNFVGVVCENKESCDPYGEYNVDLRIDMSNGLPDIIKETLTYNMTSDEMFEYIPQDKKWDIIFIDGLHEYSQVGRDIINSFKHLNKGGVILLHDCLPQTREAQIYPRPNNDIQWNGNVWKVIPQLQYQGIDFNVVTTDYGVAVLKFDGDPNSLEEFYDINMLYEEYMENNDNIQHLISVNDFYRIYAKPNDIKVGLCCIIKMENLYLREFVEYYKKIGVNNIILYDNNDINGEYPQQVINDYIDSGYVIYKNVRGEKIAQTVSYNNCMEEFHDKFNWICFFDCDEYLTFVLDNTIQEYLARTGFINASVISLNWKNYGDNNNLYYENKPLIERFTEECDTNKTDNHLKKLIIKCNNENKIIFTTPNSFTYNVMNGGIFVYNNGEPFGENYWWHINHDLAYLKHFKYMSISEYLTRRLGRRSYACEDPYDEEMIINMFRQANEMTEEKEQIIKEFMKLY